MFYKRIGNFRKILHLKPFEACGYLTSGNPHKIFDWVRNILAANAKGCPISGNDFQVNNEYAKPSPVWPAGIYKATATFSDDIDEKIYAITFATEMKNTENTDWREFK